MNRTQFETFLLSILLNAQERAEPQLHWSGKMILPNLRVPWDFKCSACGQESFQSAGSAKELTTIEPLHAFGCPVAKPSAQQREETVYTHIGVCGFEGGTIPIFEVTVPVEASLEATLRASNT